MSLRVASTLVFRCFKRVEHFGDWLTGAAGPVFIAFAWLLMGGGAIVFFGVVAPRLPLWLITVPFCLLVAANLFGHYYLACTVSPGFADDRAPLDTSGWWWAPRRERRLGRAPREGYGNARGGAGKDGDGVDEVGGGGGEVTAEEGQSERLLRGKPRERRCKKCGGMRPERAHHCRVCRRDILKYDHHWINQCVGLRNERHFVLFMAYFVLACACFCTFGYPYFFLSLDFFEDWPYWPGRTPFILIYILAGVLSVAVLIMLLWHLRLVMLGETTVENYDNDAYRRLTKERGTRFVNCFDLGWKRNLWMFFNLDEYPIYAIMLPLRVVPYTNGRTWEKADGYDRHGGLDELDEMTDEEEL
ncbi:zf-DHHC-domain-containing protein [Calocera cornea HHB12733]|uniref:Palmitoyltransferase n=1 Tax=Calocera cornea HHB12733 TaxID=1353952 RepID=A0A165DQ63_9BASI|nr:zf-DHHC-domain-containing protein [Calocera cornea HHB12733]